MLCSLRTISPKGKRRTRNPGLPPVFAYQLERFGRIDGPMQRHSHFSSRLPNSSAGSRGQVRAALSLRCEVRQGTRPWKPVVLDDLSVTGFRISGLSSPDFAKTLSIRIPGMQLLTARLCWSAGPTVGCEFSTPLHVAVFDHIVRQTRGY